VWVASAVVRAWTQLYTSGLPKDVRDGRRDEIESDLWESAHDPYVSQNTLALQIWARLIGGIFDDVRWRATQAADVGRYAWRVAASLVLAMLITLWLMRDATSSALPLPPVPQFRVKPVRMDPPPPPPPPPCLPPGFPQDPGANCMR
jgi:hypothetical protein